MPFRLLACLATLLVGAVAARSPAQDAPVALLERAVTRSGGETALRAVRTARLEYVTTWMRTTFGDGPAPAVISVENNVDLRDYGRQVWRYERRIGGGPTIIDIVRDSVAAFDFGRGWQPLSGAYLHERRELFLASPERLLVTALDAARAGALRGGADTTIAGSRHVRLVGTIDDLPATLFVRRSDAQLTGFRYRAEQPWDFGLAAWGNMDVEVWYSNWRLAGTLLLPHEIATNRVGVPYKRLTVSRAQYNLPLEEDSLVVSDSLRRRFVAEQRRAMFDVAVDSLHLSSGGLTTFGVPGTPVAAVRKGGGWLVYGSGAAPLITDRAVDKLRGASAPIAAAIVGTMAVNGAGGAPAMARAGIPLLAAASARPFLAAMFAQQKTPLEGVTWVSEPGWRVVAGDSLWLEPVDLPDTDGSLLVWDPALRLLYAGDNPGPAQLRGALAVAAARGWALERVLARGSTMPLADVRKLAGLAP